MSQSPQRPDSALNLEILSADELERVLVPISPAEQSQPEPVTPPLKKRCDSTHREILRQPFFLDK